MLEWLKGWMIEGMNVWMNECLKERWFILLFNQSVNQPINLNAYKWLWDWFN